jgi:hypothetical protein
MRRVVVERGRHLQSWERFAALLAAAVALALNIAASIELFSPQATFGYRLIYTNGFQVAAVDRATSAAQAGIVTRDHLDFRKSTLHDRIVGLSYEPARPGEAISLVVVHEGRPRALTLRAGLLTASESQEALFSPLASFLRLAGFVYIAVALIILLRRPNRMTWGLFLYLASATDVTLYRFPDWLLPAAAFASDLLSVAGTVGLVIFAVRFPDDRPLGWRLWLDRLAIPIGALFAIPNLAWDATSLFAGRSPTAWMSYGSTLGALALILVAGVTLVATYLAAQPSQRQRLQWVIAGVFFTLLSYASGWARYWSTAYPLATSNAVVWSATILYACAPFAIAYAVARQRVFEISFVVSRTLVYSLVSATIFGVFALVEWLAGRLIEHSGVAVVLVALTAVGVAYSIHAIYSRAEQFVEVTLFRRRHQAERRLADLAAGLPYAQNRAAVEEALVREPVQAYALSSAALFLRDGSGGYVQDGKTLDASVALQLQGSRRAVRLHEGDPVLAVPVFVRSRLEAVAVYGAHANGEDIDPDEAASLEAMGAAAGLAYDHLEMARIERDITRWRKLAERQARELAALRARMPLLGEHLAGDDAHGNGPM